jgi:cystathionine beta-synthase
MHHQAYDSIVDAIGHTPLVKLNRITDGLSSEIFAKLEFMNPMGSVKDRIARYMIEKAERDGRIHEGQLIVENSSGNTALGLALIARQKGYRLKVVVRDSLSPEKVNQLKALDVDVQMVDHTLPPESPDSYNNLAARLARELPDCFFPDQHNNRDNNEAHYRTTGPEIWEQMEGRINYLVAGIGTGGTLCGAGRFLKEQDARIQIIALDPVGSVFYSYFREGKRVPPAPYRIEGLGDEFLVGCVNFEVLDDVVQVTDRDAFLHARRLAVEEGILVGGSSGAAIWGVLALARKLPQPARIVTLFPDGGSRYLSTIFNNKWMRQNGYL